MNDIVIYGAGGLGREILCLIKRDYADSLNVIGFIDDTVGMPEEVSGIKILPKHILDSYKGLSVVLGFSDTKFKRGVFTELSAKKNLLFPNIISKNAVVNSDVRLGCGVIITDFCFISTNVVINDAVFINVGTAVGHDVKIDSYCSIMPQCAISGNVRIGSETLIGAKSFILQNKTVGARATLTAGAVVCRDVNDDEIAMGNPARILRQR